ncbi:MAG: S1C family serine protease [Cyanobacteria bacterium P01_A01_bin.105]
MHNALADFSAELSRILTRTSESVVAIKGRRSAATGIHWRNGFIVTACEALRQGDSLSLVLPNGQTVATELLGSDPSTHVAVLTLRNGAELPAVALGDSQGLALGQLVATVGRDPRQGVFTSLGLISQIEGPWRSQSGGQIAQYIQVSLNLSPGSAGCPLINAHGEVVGFNTFGPRRQVLTIPAATVNPVLQQFLQRGKLARGYLGLSMQAVPLPKPMQQQHALSNATAVMVTTVEPGRPADRAGLLLGDVIVTINDQVMETVAQIQALLGPQSVGQLLRLQLLRGGQMQTLTLMVEER